jgi:hypothetical protein
MVNVAMLSMLSLLATNVREPEAPGQPPAVILEGHRSICGLLGVTVIACVT